MSLFHGPSHVYLPFIVAAALELVAVLGLIRGWNGAVDGISAVTAFVLAAARVGFNVYGRWYYWMDQDKKRRRRE